MTFQEMVLPAGDHPGFDIDWEGNNPPGQRLYSRDWLSKGHEGLRVIGQGPGRTRIRPAPGVWTNIMVAQHAGTLQLENLTLHNAQRSAIQAGTGLYTNIGKFPKFKLVTRNVELLCDVPGKWGFFTFECDRDDEDLEVWGAILREHPSYAHEFASVFGMRLKNFVIHDAGAEAWKVRNARNEIRPLKASKIVIEDGEVAGWYQSWSDRGGAAFVFQRAGVGHEILIQRVICWGGHGSRCRTVMIDDGDAKAGETATGNVLLRNVAARGSSDRTDYGDTLLRVGSLIPGVTVAKSLTIDACALYGRNMSVQLGNLPAGKLVVKGSNTPQLREWANAKGIDTTVEAMIPTATRLVPVSEGLVR